MMLDRALDGVAFAGVVIAGGALWRLSGSRRLRWALTGLTAYGALAFAYATLTGLPLREALGGHGLLQSFPYVLQSVFVGAFVVLPIGWIVALVRAGIPRFREGSPGRGLHQVVALTTCVGLVLTSIPHGTPSGPSTGPGSADAKGRLQELARSFDAIEAGERDSPRDLWDPKYIVEHIGRDDAALFSWTRFNTFWVPYHGLLRGSTGVLMDRLGNSLDRAVLLATLLREAGHTVRLAHAQLPLDLAIRTLPRLIARPSAAGDASAGDTGLEAAVENAAARYQLDARAVRGALSADTASMTRIISDIHMRATDQTVRLSGLVRRLGVGSGGQYERFEAALDALRDHWWVQRQQGNEWTDFDLEADDVAPGVTLASSVPVETVELADAGVSRAHEVVVRVVAERARDGAISERTLFEHSIRPADLIGQPIVLQLWPTAWPDDLGPGGPDPKQTVRAAALDQHKWEATLVIGSDVAERAVFTDTSESEDPHVTSNPFGGLSGAFSKTMGLAGGTAGQALTAVWIEYETRVPGEPSRTARRAVFDLLGPEARASKTVPAATLSDDQKVTRSLSLMMRTEILPLASRVPPEFLAHLLADSLLKSRVLLTSAARGELDDPAAAIKALTTQTAESAPSPLYQLAVARFDLNASQDNIYIDRPTVLSRHVFPMWSQDGIVVRDAADVVTNDIGVDLLAPDAFGIRLAQGVIDSNAERLAHGPGRLVGDTSQAFAVSSDWIHVQSPEDPAFRDLNVSGDARQRIADDLRAGYTVVAPKAPVSIGGEAFVGWWRVDPKSGQVLGIGETGWGTSTAERSFLSTLAERWAKEFAFQYLLCLSMAEAAAQIDRWWMTGSSAPLGQAAAQSWKDCSLFSLIFSGFFVTLPFVTAYIAARLGMMGGIRAGFTLWLTGLRGEAAALWADETGGIRFPPDSPGSPGRPGRPGGPGPSPGPGPPPPGPPPPGPLPEPEPCAAKPSPGRPLEIANWERQIAEYERQIADLERQIADLERQIPDAEADYRIKSDKNFEEAQRWIRANEKARQAGDPPLEFDAAVVKAQNEATEAADRLNKMKQALENAKEGISTKSRILEDLRRQLDEARPPTEAAACEPGPPPPPAPEGQGPVPDPAGSTDLNKTIQDDPSLKGTLPLGPSRTVVIGLESARSSLSGGR